MNTNRINTMARLTGITIAIALLAGTAASARAQYKATGDDGITASPRVRQLLDERTRNRTPAVAPAEIPKMACPKCTDKVTKKVDLTARGANKPTVLVTTHQCNSCGNEWVVTGHGKAKRTVTVHKCTNCGAENLACCNTSKGGTVPTKGMEKKSLN